MVLLNLCQQMLHDIWAHRLRSLLAVLGIIWGTAAVILLMSFGCGFINANKGNIMNLADSTLFITADHSSIAYRGYPIGHPISFKAKDIMTLPTYITEIKRITVDLQTPVTIRTRNAQKRAIIEGTSRDFFALRKISLIANSRIFTLKERQQSRRVVIIGANIKQQLFGRYPALGRFITINNARFLVIGVIKASEALNSLNDKAIIPYTTFINIWGNWNLNFFIVQSAPHDNVIVKNNLRHFLGNHYHFHANDQTALKILDTTAFSTFFRWFFTAIEVFLALCGALTLGVGGLGVANIMFLIVTERTKEIGLRMAIGARDWQIMAQILLEAMMIVGIGGITGLILALLVVSSLQLSHLPSWLGRPVISWITVFATVIILALQAVLAGYFPAKRAASMTPTEALRT